MTKYRSVYRTILLSALVIGTGIRNQATAIAPAYTVTDLGDLGGGYSVGVGINASGHVSGTSYTTAGAAHAFLYDGTMHDLGTLGGTESVGYGINASGQVVGWSQTTGNAAQHAFLWTPTTPNGHTGTMHDLGALGETYSSAIGINDSGQVAGYTRVHAFMYDGMMHDLGTLGGTTSYGFGINASGQVAGGSKTTGDAADHAHRWTPTTPNGASGTMQDLGTLGGTNSHGNAINASGQVTGYSETTGDAATHAFLWKPTTPNSESGAMHDLGTLGGTLTFAQGINASGHVVGTSYLIGDAAQNAFLYTSGSGMVDLNTLIDPLSGWWLGFGNAINDAGQITGGGSHAFLLTPVPEPASLALLALGLPLLVRRNSRQFARGGIRGGPRFAVAATTRAI